MGAARSRRWQDLGAGFDAAHFSAAALHRTGCDVWRADELRFVAMRSEDFASVEIGQPVWVHDPDPPTYVLYAGQVTRKQDSSQILGVSIPILDRTVFPPLDRIHIEHPDEHEQAKCRWCSGG